MKVPNINGVVSIARTAMDPKTQTAKDKAGSGVSTDQVELSSQSQTVQRLAAERSSEQARTDEVAALKAAYEAGELKADPQQTAQAMVAEGLFDDIIGGK
jgi:flagellar biosynthesis anti-sigma factor FlgM